MIIKPVRRPAGDAETVTASRRWWDQTAPEYQAEHGEFLGDADFVWCPERLREADARLLGDVAGRRVLEVGAGAAQCIEGIGLATSAVGVDETERVAAVAAIGSNAFQRGFSEFARGRRACIEHGGEIGERCLGSEVRHG